MNGVLMKKAHKGRQDNREKGSILIFALTVLFFFGSLAVFLQTVSNSYVMVPSRDAEHMTEADMLMASGMEVYAQLFAELYTTTEPTSQSGVSPMKLKVAATLNSIGTITLRDKNKKKLGVFYKDSDLDPKDVNVQYTPNRDGWIITSDKALTWKMQLSDGTLLTRPAPFNLYIAGGYKTVPRT